MVAIQVLNFSISVELAARMGLQGATSFRIGYRDDPWKREIHMALLRRARAMGGESVIEYYGTLGDYRGIAAFALFLPKSPIQRFDPITPGYQETSRIHFEGTTRIYMHFARPCDSHYVKRSATLVVKDR